MALIALGALSMIWRRHQREVQRLRSAHQVTIHRLDEEHDRRLERINREFQRDLTSAHHPLAQDLLPALDSLDEALAHMEQALNEQRPGASADLYKGVELARAAIDSALARHKIQAILPAEGDPFDPQFHEAMSRREDAEAKSNSIARVMRRGYRDGDRVLRAALVEVNVQPSAQKDPEPTDDDQPSDAPALGEDSPLEPPGNSST